MSADRGTANGTSRGTELPRVRSRGLLAAGALGLTLLCAAAAIVFSGSTRSASSLAGRDHLPNLRTRIPSQLRISLEDGRKLLRFSNVVVNGGQGPLEVRPENDPSTGLTDAFQDIYTHDPDGTLIFKYDRPVGTFVFHPEHDHWHFEAFATYALHAVAEDGSIGAQLTADQDKVSFCLSDTQVANRNLRYFSDRTYISDTACGQSGTQGISVGWADKYGYRLFGQWVDVTDVPDGTYWLVSTADPMDLLDETQEGDNANAVKIAIAGSTVTLM